MLKTKKTRGPLEFPGGPNTSDLYTEKNGVKYLKLSKYFHGNQFFLILLNRKTTSTDAHDLDYNEASVSFARCYREKKKKRCS